MNGNWPIVVIMILMLGLFSTTALFMIGATR